MSVGEDQLSAMNISTSDWLLEPNGSVKSRVILKMLHLIGPDGLVNWGFVNFQKMVWMTMVHISKLAGHPEIKF